MTETIEQEKDLEELLPRIVPIWRLRDDCMIDDEYVLDSFQNSLCTLRRGEDGQSIITTNYRVYRGMLNAELEIDKVSEINVSDNFTVIYERYDTLLKRAGL